MAPLAMEMVRDIDEDTVDFQPNYDGKTQEPDVLPSRFPNLLVNGSLRHRRRHGHQDPAAQPARGRRGRPVVPGAPGGHPRGAARGAHARIKGPDFPTGALIMGTRGIEDAYRTGRGSITMRAVVEVEEIQNRTCLVVTELPYQVNPDNLALEDRRARQGRARSTGIADIRDETSGRTGQRLVIVLKRDAVAKVVLNNLYKHTQLQDNFGANMLALVDGVPRTLPLDGVHPLLGRRTSSTSSSAAPPTACARPRSEVHILRGYLKALDALDEVIALIRRSPTVDEARERPDGAARDRRGAGPRRSSTCSCAGWPPWSGRRSSTTTTSSRR